MVAEPADPDLVMNEHLLAGWAVTRSSLPPPTNAAKAEPSRGDGQSDPGRE
jgi:hypothetical protein